jgi:hypothetical protein
MKKHMQVRWALPASMCISACDQQPLAPLCRLSPPLLVPPCLPCLPRLLVHVQCSSSRVEAARKDAVSHYILRLAYCRTPELRAWLLTHEAALFRTRFRELDRQQQVQPPPYSFLLMLLLLMLLPLLLLPSPQQRPAFPLLLPMWLHQAQCTALSLFRPGGFLFVGGAAIPRH